MLNIVMLVKDRPRLTRQALESLVQNTQGKFNLTIVDDGSDAPAARAIERWQAERPGVHAGFVRHIGALGPGGSRNSGIRVSEEMFGRPGLLYLCDNDCYFMRGWDTALLEVWNSPARSRQEFPYGPPQFEVIGGYVHPFQRPISQMRATATHSLNELAALGLLSWLMAWETWDKYGSFDPSPTINGSEDWSYCQRIRNDGGKVGVVEPQLVLNCGVTSSDGKPCPGAALLYDQAIPEGVVIE